MNVVATVKNANVRVYKNIRPFILIINKFNNILCRRNPNSKSYCGAKVYIGNYCYSPFNTAARSSYFIR